MGLAAAGVAASEGTVRPFFCLAGGRAPLVPVLGAGRAVGNGRIRASSGGLGIDVLELQGELHRRVGKGRDRRERDHQPLRDAAKRQADLEALLRDDQVPELVLQDDGHVLWILRTHALGHFNPFGASVEGDVEMVIAWQAAPGDVFEHSFHHAAERVLGEDVVADMIGGHGLVACCRSPAAMPAVGLMPLRFDFANASVLRAR